MHSDLLERLVGLDGVFQSPRYHPEGDALFHSLQVFELARCESDEPELWAAALFHDVGKAIDSATHDEVGADLLEGLMSDRVVWLVRHHLDLLREPRRTRRELAGTTGLRDLECLRRWDLGGRRMDARVSSADDALSFLLHQAGSAIFAAAPEPHEREDRSG